MRSIATIGDAGASATVGGLMLSSSPPVESDYLPLTGLRYQTADYPDLAQDVRYSALGLTANSDAAAIATAAAVQVGEEVFYIGGPDNRGELYKLPLAGGAAVKVGGAPAILTADYSYRPGLWHAGGRFWRWVYYTPGSYYLLISSADGLTWTSTGVSSDSARGAAVWFAGKWVAHRSAGGGMAWPIYSTNAGATAWGNGAGYGAADGWEFPIEWGGALYMWSDRRTAVARSLDGVNWTVLLQAGLWPLRGSVVYHAASGKFFGVNGASIISSASPTGPWAVETTLTGTASYLGVVSCGRLLLAFGSTIWTTTGLASLSWSAGDGVWREAYAGKQNDLQPFWPIGGVETGYLVRPQVAVEVGGQLALFANGVTRRLANLADTFDLRVAPQVFNRNLYVKAR